MGQTARWSAAAAALALLGCGGGIEATLARRELPGDRPLIGTAHPYVLQELATDGSWLVLCQARGDTTGDGAIEVKLGLHGDTYGDQLDPYFVRGAGPGRRFDELVATSRDDRHLAVVERPRLHLLDARTGAATPLPRADVDNRPLEARLLDPRPAAEAVFSPDGRLLAYAARVHDRRIVVVRQIEGGTEVDIDPGPVALGRFDFDAAGCWLLLEVVPHDTDGNGTIELPALRSSLAPARCRGPVTSFSMGPAQGDEVALWAAPATGGEAREAPPELTAPRPRDEQLARDAAAIRLGPGEEIVAARARRVLIRRAASLALRDLDRGTERALLAIGPDDHLDLLAGPMVAFGGAVIDLDRARVVGHYQGRILALDAAGRVLVAAEVLEAGFRLPRGPLWWEGP